LWTIIPSNGESTNAPRSSGLRITFARRGAGCCREDIVLHRILPPILALLTVVALDCGDIGAQDYWQVAFEDLPPIDFPEASGSEGEAKKTTPQKVTDEIKPLPSPSLPGGGLRPEDVLDLDSTPSGSAGSSTENAPSTGEPKSAGQETPFDVRQVEVDQDPLFEGTVDHHIRDFLAPVFSSGDWYQNGCTFVNARGAGIWRSSGKSKVLAQDLSGLTDLIPGDSPRQITTRDKGFHFAPGLGLTIGRFLGRDSFNRDTSVEFSFLGLMDWDTYVLLGSAIDNELFTAINLDGPGHPSSSGSIPTGVTLIPGFDAVSQQDFEYSSDFDSFEFNIRIAHRPGRDRMVAMPNGTWTRQIASGGVPSFFAGLRYIQIDERLLWTSRGTPNPIHGDPTTPVGVYDINTHNALVGMQFGGDYKWITKNWNAGAMGKAGAYINFSDLQRTIRGTGMAETQLPQSAWVSPPLPVAVPYMYANNLPNQTNVPPPPAPPGFSTVNPNAPTTWHHADAQSATAYAAFLETEMFAEYNVNPNLSFRFAWEQFWINGLAMAPYQITFEPERSRLNVGGNAYFTGLSLSGRWVW